MSKAQKDIIRYRGTKQWTLQIPLRINNENEIVRRATREIDELFSDDAGDYGFRKWIIGLFCFFAVLFLGIELGMFDWIYRLFR